MKWWVVCIICIALLLLGIVLCGCINPTYNLCLGNQSNDSSKTTDNDESNISVNQSSSGTATTNVGVPELDNPKKHKGGGLGMNLATFFGIYGQILMHLAMVIGLGILIMCLAVFGRKWLGTLGNFLPKKTFVYALAIGVFLIRWLISGIGLWSFPVGELLIDSILALMVAQELYTVVIKRKLLKKD